MPRDMLSNSFTLALAGILSAGLLPGQSPRPAFEVASVKQNKVNNQAGIQIMPSGRLMITNVPLIMIIETAYNFPFQTNRLSDVPNWVGTDRFDIEATPPADAIPSGATSRARAEAIRQMMQTLLADRFKMVIRRESKEQAVYAVVVGKNGPKLERSKLEEKDCRNSAYKFGESTSCHSITGGRGRGMHADAVDVSDMAVFVANWTDHPVVDRSGLTGLFRVNTDGWLPMEPRPAPAPDARGEDGKLLADQPTIFEIFERLGLKLELQKAPVDMFVIEHIEKLTEN